MPLPGTKIVHPSLQRRHSRAIETSFTAWVRFVQPDGQPGDWDPVTNTVTAEAEPVIYEGAARIQAQASQALSGDAAGQQVTSREYLVVISAQAPAIKAAETGGAVCIVIACPDDIGMQGRRLAVVDAASGSIRWERDLICRDDLSSR